MSTLLFYDKAVVLNKNIHKKLKIKPSENDFSFSKKTNSVILAGAEFAEAAKEFPIVFASTADDKIVPVALLGLRNEENLFINEDGSWGGKYIPAFIRRYPFVLAGGNDDTELTVCIDESYEGLNEKEGKALFKGGKNTPVLDNAIKFLGDYQKEYRLTETVVAELKEHDLFQTLNARFDLKDGRQFSLSSFMVIDEKKLLELDKDIAMELFKKGRLGWVYSHLISLSNMNALVERIPAEKDEKEVA